jgi:putative oxidoreductase
MTSQPLHDHGPSLTERETRVPARTDSFLAPLGRALYGLIFILAGPTHFSSGTIHYAASHGVPLAQISVPIAGIIAMLGGLSVLIGYRARLGALLIIVFLIPVTLAMHDFWAVADPRMAQLQMAMFLKNVSMLGGALLIAYFGAGPVSADEHAAKRHG